MCVCVLIIPTGSTETETLKPFVGPARCKLVRVPAVVERLSALRILDLTNNRLTNAGLPGSLARLPHLKAIGLKKNCLTAVPRVLGAMRSLQEIYLEDNTELEVRAPQATKCCCAGDWAPHLVIAWR